MRRADNLTTVCLEIWEPQPTGILCACPRLYRGCFNFTMAVPPCDKWLDIGERRVVINQNRDVSVNGFCPRLQVQEIRRNFHSWASRHRCSSPSEQLNLSYRILKNPNTAGIPSLPLGLQQRISPRGPTTYDLSKSVSVSVSVGSLQIL